ncbi:hypothetical protein [Actinacidiphila glaucinigra]|uniref:hypothetical protein n=1 Tax=Actinacidiphila glaucinigra TaxID=235986 RepID=UPI00366E2649
MDATRMGYGYCDICRDFHAASADGQTGYTPPPMKGGGFMRCCSASLRAWAVYHRAPWTPGTLVRCVFSQDARLHAMRYCACGHWHWCRDTCQPG